MVHFSSVCRGTENKGHVATGNASEVHGRFSDFGRLNVDKVAGLKMSTCGGEGEFRGGRFAARKPALINTSVAWLVQGGILAAMHGCEVTFSVCAQDFGSTVVEWACPVVMVLPEVFIEFVFTFVATFACGDGTNIVAIIGMNLSDMARQVRLSCKREGTFGVKTPIFLHMSSEVFSQDSETLESFPRLVCAAAMPLTKEDAIVDCFTKKRCIMDLEVIGQAFSCVKLFAFAQGPLAPEAHFVRWVLARKVGPSGVGPVHYLVQVALVCTLWGRKAPTLGIIGGTKFEILIIEWSNGHPVRALLASV
jgi:hypothetical protein